MTAERASHPDVEVLDAFYAAQGEFYAGGPEQAVRELLAEDVVWHVPGRSAIAGDHRGRDAVLAYFARRRELSGTTFRVEPGDILANDRVVVQFAGGTMERGGRPVSWQTIGVFRIAEGRVAECWLIPFDQYAFDEIWS